MERRLIFAIVLSSVVLLFWQALFYKPATPPATAPVQVEPIPSSPQLDEEPLPSSSLNFPQEKFELTFIESQAAIQEAIFKAYPSDKFILKHGFLLPDKKLVFKKESSTPEAITFLHQDATTQITKRFLFSNSNYAIELELKIENVSRAPVNINLPLVLGVLNFSRDPKTARFQDITVALKDKALHPNAHKDTTFKEIKFLGLRDRYFCAIIEPAADGYTGYIKKIAPQESEIGLIMPGILLASGQKKELKFRIYLGPQELQLITSIQPHWASVMHYGTFDFIAHLLLQLLALIYHLVHNWGVAIIILSVVIYLLLFPLNLKQLRSTKQMQALQPRIEELKKMYKDNPQKQNKEIMELFREYKVNPLAGCLPLILQIPVFFALYQALMRSIALRGARFLWIKDLSEPDRLFMLTLSGKKIEINILPILMTIGMFLQQKLSLTTTTSSSAEQQKLMLIMMPLIFGFVFYQMPSGLVLYWFINSFLMLAYQMRMHRLK